MEPYLGGRLSATFPQFTVVASLSPYPSQISMPYFSFQLRATSRGIGAEPQMQVFRELKSYFEAAGWLSNWIYMVGTPRNSGIWYCSMRFIASSASHRLGRISFPPVRNSRLKAKTPYPWNKGRVIKEIRV